MIDHPTGAGPIWRLYLATVVGCTGKKSSAAAEIWGPNIGAWPPPGSVRATPLGNGRITGQYLGRDVHLGNRRIFRVLRETHFPWSVLKGKTGFRLLSSRNDQRRRRHGPEDPILFYFQKSPTSRQKSIFHRGFTVTPCRLKAARHTPNNPRYTRDEPGTDCCHLGARFTSLRLPRPPPTTTAHPHLPCLTWCM